ncbi:hypothetical protein [Pseudomonas palleroniana]|uniref:hypothetical protein n=1 Tax=Pseudomonas palleroniana TaxID=191390 RepID=UPI0018E6A194|nr:hypothetical protein [Pseudomonas palleroniana]MBI6911089.1 hypothetical protein [Pseudomonas palleroniana]
MLNDCGKELVKPWMSVQNFVLVLALIFCVALMKPSSSELASWVQALGSIGAIWGALAVSRKQISSQSNADTKRAELRDGAYLAVIESACKNVRKLSEYVEGCPTLNAFLFMWDYHVGGLFESNLEMLKGIPAHELGSYDLVVSHSVMITKMIRIQNRVRELREVSNQYKRVQERWVKFQFSEITGDNELVQDAFERYKVALEMKLSLMSSSIRGFHR